MAAYIEAADAIREEFGCCVIIVHHCGINDSRPRGHTSLTCAVDVQIAVVRQGNTAQMTVEWMKEGAEGDQFTSVVEVIEVGVDEDGEPITSCVVIPAETGAFAGSKRSKLTDTAQIALRALADALCEHGEIPQERPAQIPADARVVGIAEWRRFAYARGISGSEGERAKQQAFKRSFNKLVSAGRATLA